MWNYPGDLDRLAARIALSDDHTIVTTLNQALTEIAGRQPATSQSPAAPPSDLPPSDMHDATPALSTPRS
jgi:hypothetical protein